MAESRTPSFPTLRGKKPVSCSAVFLWYLSATTAVRLVLDLFYIFYPSDPGPSRIFCLSSPLPLPLSFVTKTVDPSLSLLDLDLCKQR